MGLILIIILVIFLLGGFSGRFGGYGYGYGHGGKGINRIILIIILVLLLLGRILSARGGVCEARRGAYLKSRSSRLPLPGATARRLTAEDELLNPSSIQRRNQW